MIALPLAEVRCRSLQLPELGTPRALVAFGDNHIRLIETVIAHFVALTVSAAAKNGKATEPSRSRRLGAHKAGQFHYGPVQLVRVTPPFESWNAVVKLGLHTTS